MEMATCSKSGFQEIMATRRLALKYRIMSQTSDVGELKLKSSAFTGYVRLSFSWLYQDYGLPRYDAL
jgi:hypothetical protein